jgi:hypothetical protein
MPSRIVRELQSGVGVASTRRTDPVIPRGIAVPGSFSEDEVDNIVGGAWTIEEGMPALREDWDSVETTFVTETADSEVLELRSLAEAKRRPDWPLWEKAIEEELGTLKAAKTWRLEHAPPGANVIGSKWVFKAKKDASGRVVRYKARLVAQGFSQIGGVDYDDTYAPVAKLASSRLLIAMANRNHLELHQIDIKGAYLNGELTEDEVLYMQHPPGYKDPTVGTCVLRLQKALYGLKQAGRRWYQKFKSILAELGLEQCKVDQAVFYRAGANKHALLVVAVHVDDCTIAARTRHIIIEFIDGLKKHLDVTDLVELHWMLGIEVKRDREAKLIHLSQLSYIDSILRRFGFEDLKSL